MRKKVILYTIIVLLFSVILNARNGKKMFIEAQGMVVFPSDSRFKDIYGSTIIYPRFKAAYKFGNHFYAFFGCGVLKKSGETLVLKSKADSKQKICQIALGYEGDISKKMQFRLEIGGTNFNYSETAFNKTVEGAKLGVSLGGSVVYNFSNSFFSTFNIGYMGASDKVNDKNIKLGGIHTGIGIGIRI